MSSVTTMSETSLVTSVPVMPMATPMSASLTAGASLTPSPVMATTSPRFRQARTMRSLCSGETRAYTGMRPTSRAQLLVGPSVKVLSGQGQGVPCQEAELPGDGHGRVLVVAGDHDGPDAGPLALGHRRLDLLPRRIDHRHQAGEHQISLDVRRRRILGKPLERAVGERQDAHGPVGELVVRAQEPRPVGLGQGTRRAALVDGRAVAEQDVGRALDEGREAAPVLADDGHLLALGVEGKLFDGGVSLLLDLLENAALRGGREDGRLGRVPDDAPDAPSFRTREALLQRTPP